MSDFETVFSFLAPSISPENLPRADAIFVHGNIEPRIAEHAGKIWQLGKAPYIVLTGSVRKEIPGGFATEAEHHAHILKNMGIPSDVILAENQSLNTPENIRFGIPLLQTKIPQIKALIITAQPPLLRRAIATFGKQHPEIELFPSAYDAPLSEWNNPKRSARLLGEFDRFEEYENKGDLVPVNIPKEVAEAARKLKETLS